MCSICFQSNRQAESRRNLGAREGRKARLNINIPCGERAAEGSTRAYSTSSAVSYPRPLRRQRRPTQSSCASVSADVSKGDEEPLSQQARLPLPCRSQRLPSCGRPTPPYA